MSLSDKMSTSKASSKTPVLVLYLPVIHNGYMDFLQKHSDAQILVLANDVTDQFKPLRKDIRALKADQVAEVLRAWKIGSEVVVADADELKRLNTSAQQVLMPGEEPMAEVAAKYFPKAKTKFIDVFLRWDKKKTLAQQQLDNHDQVSTDPQDQKFMKLAQAQATKSVDQWRQVGAVLVKDGLVLFSARNRHLPDDSQPVFAGDPRGNFSKGQHIDLSTAQHAEAAIVAAAAKQGVSVAGADLYVTTFPCPVCAKLVAETGVKRVLFEEGYAMVDGLRVLQESGIGVERVEAS